MQFFFNTFSPKVGTLSMSCSISIKCMKAGERANSKTLKLHVVPWKVKPVPVPFSNLCVDIWPLVLQVLFCLKKDKTKSCVNSTQQGQGTFKTQRISSTVLVFIDSEGLSKLRDFYIFKDFQNSKTFRYCASFYWFSRSFNTLKGGSQNSKTFKYCAFLFLDFWGLSTFWWQRARH